MMYGGVELCAGMMLIMNEWIVHKFIVETSDLTDNK